MPLCERAAGHVSGSDCPEFPCAFLDLPLELDGRESLLELDVQEFLDGAMGLSIVRDSVALDSRCRDILPREDDGMNARDTSYLD